jgi:hypothetical protein
MLVMSIIIILTTITIVAFLSSARFFFNTDLALSFVNFFYAKLVKDAYICCWALEFGPMSYWTIC